MIRLLITGALLFLLPCILFAIYATVWDRLARAQPAADGDQSGRSSQAPASAWHNPPIGWLTAAGAALVLGTLAYFASYPGSGGSPDGVYHPPQFKDGKLLPGHVE